MAVPGDSPSLRWTLPGLFMVALAMLGYEVALARVIAIQHWFHLAQLVIAIALLGFGCAGAIATLCAEQLRRRASLWLCCCALLLSLSIALGPGLAQALPLNMLALPWQNREALHLLLYGLVFLPPFFAGGLFITICFLLWPDSAGRVYAFDLLGSACGALGVLFAVRAAGLEVTLLVLALLPLAVALALGWRHRVLCGLVVVAVLVALAAHSLSAVAPSPYKTLPVRMLERHSHIQYQDDGLLHRHTVLSSPGLHAAPGLSLASGRSAPPQWQLFVDGDSPVPLLLEAAEQGFFRETLAYAPYLVAPPRPRVLLLDSDSLWHGWAAAEAGASAITALSADRDLIAILSRLRSAGQGAVYPDKLRFHNASARRYLQSSDAQQDVIVLQLSSPEAGIAAAQEDYLLTLQGLESAFHRLAPEGVLAAQVRLHSLPRESLRLVAMVIDMLRQQGLDPVEHLAMLRDWRSGLVLVGKEPLQEAQVAELASWARQWRFDITVAPGLDNGNPGDFHQSHVDYRQPLQTLLSGDAKSFRDGYLFALSAATDNRPFFYRFFRWQGLDELRGLGPHWRQHLEWGYLLGIVALLGGALLAALLLALPFAVARQRPAMAGNALPLGYFTGIGLGFMLIEISLLQKAALLLDATALAMSTAVAATLAGAGIGSACLHRWRFTRPALYRLFALVAILAALVLPLMDWLFSISAAWPLGGRLALVVAVIALVAVPMGVPLPWAIRHLQTRPAATIAWAWAVNGFASVLGALAAGLIAMHWGLYAVMVAGTACYGLAAACARGFGEREGCRSGQLTVGS